jgi:hypothetical protein
MPATCSARCASPGSRRRAGCSASWPRSRPGWWRARVTSWRRRGAAAALGATGGFSFLFGPLFLMSILLYRDYFYRSSVGTAEGHVGGLVIASGIGYACAALITPPVTRRLSKPAWITLLLMASAVVTMALGETFNQVAYLAIGFCLYLTRQGVAICATTILQEEVGDAYRGRVFAFYDMMFNVTYVASAPR